FFTDQLNQSGDVGALVRSILQSPEFQARETQFAAAYFGGGGTPIGGAMTRTGVRLVLDRDGPLGRAGQTLLVPDDRVILPALLAEGGWNTQHLAMLADRIDPARNYTLIDIGANIGLFARQVLQAFDNVAACHCIEPDPGNFDALRYNLADYPGVQIHPFGLGAADGTARFFRDRENCGNHSVHADAMRDRPFTETTVTIRAAGAWLTGALVEAGPLLWKSDTQGNDEIIVAATPWPVWRRVEFAMIELWRIRKDATVPRGFLDRVADMPHRRLGGQAVSADTVAEYLSGDDWAHDDLFLWR
ncbi:MAG: FkbM family methyltransferase, partial [Gemmatimonadaceae bacterium]|nr:FkbM family methyltransferase [Acetobacteraceae bacterium]